MVAVKESKEECCKRLLDSYFKKFPDLQMQIKAGYVLKYLLSFNNPFPGKPGGWAGGIVYALANQYSIPCGVPGLLNADCERFFNTSMSAIYKRAAMIKKLLISM